MSSRAAAGAGEWRGEEEGSVSGGRVRLHVAEEARQDLRVAEARERAWAVEVVQAGAARELLVWGHGANEHLHDSRASEPADTNPAVGLASGTDKCGCWSGRRWFRHGHAMAERGRRWI